MKFITKYGKWIVAAILIFNAARLFLAEKNWTVSLVFLALAAIVALQSSNKAKS